MTYVARSFLTVIFRYPTDRCKLMQRSMPLNNALLHHMKDHHRSGIYSVFTVLSAYRTKTCHPPTAAAKPKITTTTQSHHVMPPS
ncbi:hypothetical protein BDW60DRAFT_165685 [Aspergillus nidulans var. acristatus]